MTSHRVRNLRLLALAAAVVSLIALGAASGLRERFSLEALRAMMKAAGPIGALLFVAAVSLGELIQIPGLVFIAAAIIAYGRLWGGALSWVAAVISIMVTFFFARSIGGQALSTFEHPLLKRILGTLDQRPVRTVFLLRAIFLVSPPINYALALSSVKTRDYLLGSAMGLLLSVSFTTLVFDWVFAHFLIAH